MSKRRIEYSPMEEDYLIVNETSGAVGLTDDAKKYHALHQVAKFLHENPTSMPDRYRRDGWDMLESTETRGADGIIRRENRARPSQMQETLRGVSRVLYTTIPPPDAKQVAMPFLEMERELTSLYESVYENLGKIENILQSNARVDYLDSMPEDFLDKHMQLLSLVHKRTQNKFSDFMTKLSTFNAWNHRFPDPIYESVVRRRPSE